LIEALAFVLAFKNRQFKKRTGMKSLMSYYSYGVGFLFVREVFGDTLKAGKLQSHASV